MSSASFVGLLVLTGLSAASVGVSTGSFSWACTTVVVTLTVAHVVRAA